MSKKKVCMVVSNPFTHDARVSKQAKSLAKVGYDVTVYALAKRGFPSYEEVDGLKVRRLKIARYSPVAIKNPFRLPLEVVPAIIKLIGEKSDVYHAHDLDTLFSCAAAARVNKARLVYDSHELYMEMLKSSRTGTVSKKVKANILVFFYSLIERLLIKKADAVITVSDPLKNILSDKYRVKNITVLMNCPPLSGRVKNSKKFHKMFNLPNNAKAVLYQGGMQISRGLENIIESVPYLSSDTYLIMMGNGDDLPRLKNYSKSIKVSGRVKFLPAVPLKDLPDYTASAHVGVVQMLNTSLNNYYGLPNKIFEYMSVGLPVAAVNFPNLKKVVEETGAGTLFDGEDPKDIARAINEILSDPKKRKKMGLNALKASREKYNWEIEEKKLLKIYKEL